MLNTEIKPVIKISKRSKHIRLAVHVDGRVVLTVPKKGSVREALGFFEKRRKWIEQQIAKFQKRPQKVKLGSKREYINLKMAALNLAKDRLKHFNQIYKLEFKDVKVRDQKSRWGSCSRKGNLTFNYRIALLSPKLVDYVIVHELCHIKEFNHSSNFWSLVAMTIPDYKQLKRALNKFTLK